MPLLDAADPAARALAPARVLVAGASGSGKTTAARRIGRALSIPSHELDALHHGSGWVKRPEFEADVDAFSAGPTWVCEWQYDTARPLLAGRADALVWLDVPVRVQMRQVVLRTLRRWVRREELWNGNREGPPWRMLTDREHIIRWAWRARHTPGDRVRELLAERPEFPVVRVRSRRELRAWLAALAAQ
ncbi:AAA family ATPase [Kocuria polaris]|nr:AAA family ATPase [Kocuria polaris]